MDNEETAPVKLPAAGGKPIFFGSLEGQERTRLERMKLQGNVEEGTRKETDVLVRTVEGTQQESAGKKGVAKVAVKANEGKVEEEEGGRRGGGLGEAGKSGSEGEEEGNGEGSEEEDEEEDDEEMEVVDEEAEAARRFELSEASRKARERQEQVLAELELKRRARALAVPTNDGAVRRRLRAIGEPITLFGEREMERRERLRGIMARLDAAGQLSTLLDALKKEEEHAAGAHVEEQGTDLTGKPELFFTEGSNELLQARLNIAKFSLPRAAERLRRAKRRREDPDEDEDAETAAVVAAVARGMSMECSEIGDERPLSGCSFSPDASLLATSGWSGNARLWSVPAVKNVALLRGHTERVTAIVFHPHSGSPSLSPSAANVATASADRTALLWPLPSSSAPDGGNEETAEGAAGGSVREGGAATASAKAAVCAPLRKFTGHLDRLARIAFHPSGRYIGTTSFDKTWRLWDVETGTELLLQEGHSRAVYGIGFQCDGSIVATCGLDALARVWDLRSGRSILALEAHVKPLLCCEFSPNGYHLATAGEDHTCRIWDLRRRSAKKCCIYTIPAHTALVSQVKWEPRDGHFLLTAAYDNTARVWSGRDFKPVKSLGHEGKVMGADVAPDGTYIATASYDRTVKLWSSSEACGDIGMQNAS